MPLHVSNTMCSSSGGQKLYYTASGIITPIGSRPVHLCTGRPPMDVMIADAVQYNFDLLTMSTWCSKHVEA